MGSIVISSLNCQGLGDMRKRRDVFHYLRKKSHNIYCLQDTHFDNKLEKYVKSEWGYSCYFSSYQSNSRGVAILFNNNFEFKVKHVERDTNGNYIIILFTAMEKDILLVNLYGPNRDNPEFYVNISEKIRQYDKNGIIFTGDWNLVLNPHLDYDNYKNINNPKAKEAVDDMISEFSLADVWRESNPQLKRFTWRKQMSLKQCRLDFFLFCEELMGNYQESDIIPGYRSDHSMVILKLRFGNDIQHKTFWKFNYSLLRDKQYIKEINDEIDNIVIEYSKTELDTNMLEDTSFMDIDLEISDKSFLDFLLMKIRGKTISYATARKKKESEKECRLIKEIEILEKDENKTEDVLKHLKEKNEELITLRKKKIDGVILRSKAKWVAEGEKITNYFCSLEKRHFVSKHMNKLIDKKGRVIEEHNEIKKEVSNFYKDLYTKKSLNSAEINELIEDCPKLSNEMKLTLEGEITLEEAGEALKNMKNGKSPGSDGFGAEFYKFFWKKLGPFVVRALNQSFKDGEMSATQREGLITCIPKPDKEKEYIKNWRPISLLNVLYKIGTSCIANRIKTVLPELISEDQTGFISNRYMGDNIRLIYDLISYLDKKNLPGLLLCLDFEKAFDSLDWGFLLKVLRTYHFGNDVCRWIKTFYSNIKSTVIVNGCPSDWFEIQRGCRQGDPLSPYLFILCVEILSIMIKENKEIKGIVVNNNEIKISQFADDAQLINPGDQLSFESSIKVIHKFGDASGLFMNEEKTQAIWLGKSKNSKVKYLPHLNINWNPNKFKILGIWFTVNIQECEKINCQNKLEEVRTLLNIWMKRSITPVGRVAILRSLLLSKLVHLWMLLPDPPDNIIDCIQKLCFRFVWQNKQDRISRKTVVKRVKDGGLSIPDVRKYIQALKLTWLRKYKATNHKWKSIANELCPFLNNIDQYGPDFTLIGNTSNKFWRNIFTAYTKFCSCIEPKSVLELVAEPLFYNNKFKIDNKYITGKSWIQRGVYLVSHFLREDGEFLTLHEFNDKYNMNVNFLTFNGYKMCIKQYSRLLGLTINCNSTDSLSGALKALYSVHKGSQAYYEILSRDDTLPNCCLKWSVKLKEEIAWNKVFLQIHYIKDVKLRWLQIRIVHRIIGTNIVLKEMGIVDNNKCTFCLDIKDHIEHIFWQCIHVTTFWKNIETNLKARCITATNIRLTQTLILFGTEMNTKTDPILDLLIVLGKMFIYKCKMDRNLPTAEGFEHYVNARYILEEHNAKLSCTLSDFKRKWQPYLQFFQHRL